MRKIQAVGSWKFNYALFCRWYGFEPRTIEQFFSLLDCIPIFMELENKWQ